MRQQLSYYPNSVWLCLILQQFDRINQQSAFVGRSGMVGDEIGSQIIGTEIVHDIMKLCFLYEKKYFPYSKWFGSAFAKLDCSKDISPSIKQVLQSLNWKEREQNLGSLYKVLGKTHNDVFRNFVGHIDADFGPVQFHGRPFFVPNFPDEKIKELLKSTQDSEITMTFLGSIDQVCNNTILLESPQKYEKMVSILEVNLTKKVHL